MTRQRVAIVGAGIGAQHLEGYLALPDLFEVTTICDLDRRRAAPMVDASGASFSASLPETLASDAHEIIDICLPPQLHKSTILDALAHGKHVICEKPLVGSLVEVDEVEAALAASDRALMPIFQYRFGEGIGRLARLIEYGLTGKPMVATLETHWHRPSSYYDVPWRGKWAGELGGAIVGHAIHIHDLVVSLLGPVVGVQAMLSTRVNAIETEDCAAIILEMANGALVTSSVTLGSAEDCSRLRFCFDWLSAESGVEPYNPGKAPWTFTARPPIGQAAIDGALADYPKHKDGFTRQLELFYSSLQNGHQPPVTLADARASLELITAIYEAARTQSKVHLPLPKDAVGYAGWLPAR